MGTQQVPTGWAHGRLGPVILEGSREVVSPACSTDDNAVAPTAWSPRLGTDVLLPRLRHPRPQVPYGGHTPASEGWRDLPGSFSRPVLQDPMLRGAEVGTEFQADRPVCALPLPCRPEALRSS